MTKHLIPGSSCLRAGVCSQCVTSSRLPAPAEETEVNIMGKSMDTKKDNKKKPAKTVKEKRAEKKSKKDAKG